MLWRKSIKAGLYLDFEGGDDWVIRRQPNNTMLEWSIASCAAAVARAFELAKQGERIYAKNLDTGKIVHIRPGKIPGWCKKY